MKNKTIGITGSTGFLGKKLASYLMERGLIVRCLVRNRSKVPDNPAIEHMVGDILDPDSLEPFLADLDICIHLAAFVGYGTKKQYREVNVTGTKNICDILIKENPSCRLVFCSSIAVLKRKKRMRFLNTQYAESKYLAQKYVEEKTKDGLLNTSIVYSGMIYGPHDERFLPTVIRHIKKGNLVLITGGEKNAPLIYIDDLCDLFYKIITHPESSNQSYIGVKPSESGIHDFYRLIAEKLGLRNSFKKVPKMLLLPLAVFFDEWHQFFRIRKQPALSKRTVDVLSLNFPFPENKTTNNIQWIPSTDMEDGLSKALNSLFPMKQQGESHVSNG